MDLQFVNSSIRKSRYENEAVPSQLRGMKMPVSVNLELVYPNQVQEGTAFLLVNRVALGNPVQKFSLYMEQIVSFRIVDLEEGFDTSRENMQKFISLICHPISLREAQKGIDALCALYQIPQVKLPTGSDRGSGSPVVDMSGKGILN